MISKYNTPLYYVSESWQLTQGQDLLSSGIILASQGSLRIQSKAFSGNVIIRLGVAGAGNNEGLEIQRRVLDSFTLTVLDDVSSAMLYTFPAGQFRASDFLFDSNAGVWKAGGNVSISKR